MQRPIAPLRPVDDETSAPPRRDDQALFSAELAANNGRNEALLDVRSARRQVEQAEVNLRDAVMVAKFERGLSWARIGLATGLTAEGARRRWGR